MAHRPHRLAYYAGVYFTGAFEDRRLIGSHSRELSALGYEITSTWHDRVEPEICSSEQVVTNLSELNKADIIIVDGRLGKRSMWELGYATATGASRVIVGPSLHFYLDSLPVERYATWSELMRAFLSLSKSQFKKGASREKKETEFL